MYGIFKQENTFQARTNKMEKSFLLGVILALSSSTAAGLALGGTKCTWGPSYWCANIPQVSSVL